MATPNSNLMHFMNAVDELGKIASGLIAAGVSSSDIKLAVKRKFNVKISNATAKRIMQAVLIVW
jgi:hypothetical protein